MNLPNKLSMLRIILVPFLLIAFYYEKGQDVMLISAIIFAVASFTDFLDGHIARKYNMVTDFGKFVDPLADKVLVACAMICLVEKLLVPGWIVVIIIAREYAITVLRGVAATSGKVIAASKGGKLKTCTQIAAVLMLFLNIPGGIYVMYLAAVITFITGIDYLVKNKQVISDK